MEMRCDLSKDKDVMEVSGTIVEAHRGGNFIVEVMMGDQPVRIIARPSGKMTKFAINLVIGDIVTVEMSPYDLTKGRITFRKKN